MHLAAAQGSLTLLAESGASFAPCLLCGWPSRRTRSSYAKTVSDLPWRGIAVKVEVRARRFLYDRKRGRRRIFCGRLEEVAARARKTYRLEEALLAIALELGGEAGARLARELGLLVSPDALLALEVAIRQGGEGTPEKGSQTWLGGQPQRRAALDKRLQGGAADVGSGYGEGELSAAGWIGTRERAAGCSRPSSTCRS